MHAISFKLFSGKNSAPSRHTARRIDERLESRKPNLRLSVVNGDLMGWEALKTAENLSTTPIQAYDGITLSLERMKSIDSAGIAVLVRLYSQLKRQNKTLVLDRVPEEVRGFLTKVGLFDVLINNPKPARRRGTTQRRSDPWRLRTQPSR